MKKILGIAAAALMISLLAGCATTKTASSNIKGGNKAKVGRKSYQIVDYQGATLGKEVPAWEELLVEGQYSQQVLSKVMPGLEGKKVFVTTGRGDNLDFVRSWTDLVQIETEVSGALERVTGKAVTASMEGNASQTGTKADPTQVERTLNDFRMAVQTVRISGLEKIAEYWILTEVTEKKELVDTYYEYYAVWAMNEDNFNRQLDAALGKIRDTTSETEELKEMVKDKLRDTLAISNSPEVIEQSDEFVIEY